jgi:hypothetical protein
VVINHYLDDLETDEPIGFDELELSIKRDPKYHGMQFEASTSTLEFYGEGAEYLKEKKALHGLRAEVIYRATVTCEGDTEAQEVVRGRLNFGKYKDSCGTTCRVSMPVEEDSCQVVFKSRFDQKVDLDSPVAFDKLTGLPPYSGLGITMEIPAKALEVGTEGYVSTEGDIVNLTNEESLSAYFYIRPIYERELSNSIDTGQVKNVVANTGKNDVQGGNFISPQLLFEDLGKCFNTDFNYNIRLKGNFSISGNNDFVSAKLRFLEYFPTDTDISLGNDSTVLAEFTIVDIPGGTTTFPQAYSYDQTFTGAFTAREGYGYYAIIQFALFPGDYDIFNEFDPETYFLIENTKLCPATDSQVYLIHETLSRVTEAITDRCMRVKSDYYGRIDSEPFAASADGCGGLRLLTSGLKLRQAPDDKDNFFTSAKDLLEGLWGIDNIGFGVEADTTLPGYYVLRVEPVDYFYQDSEVLALPYIPQAEGEVQETGHYSRILIGYKRWEVEEVNGLGEPNSNREYRTSLETISNPLDATSALVAGSYPIEVTRQQSFAESGKADTSYDNEVFIICIEREAYGFHVEQGNITSPVNLFDPATILNYRLTPARNMMRWAKSVFNSYVNITTSSDRIFFASGTGNVIAAGQLTGADCRLEAGVLAENQDISLVTFANQADATPLFRPETITFEYPLSVADYQELKANPYGTIAYGCGSAEYLHGFIKEIKFKVAKGKATFTLIKKW